MRDRLSELTITAAIAAVAASALNGPLVSAPSEPAPVVLGEVPVSEHT